MIVMLLTLWLGGCAAPGQGGETATCGPPAFPYEGGWLGGDAAYSVPLDFGRSLWLFGDTFVGKNQQTTRAGAFLVHNSIAISECPAGGRWKIDYHWTRAEAGQSPRAFFDPGDPSHYWWPFDGFVHEGVLFVGLLSVEPSPPRGPLALPFRFSGMQLARIENPEAPPSAWRSEIIALSSSRVAFPGAAMVIDGDHLYLFAFLDRDDTHYPRILTRLPLAALGNGAKTLPEQFETLTRDGSWQPGLVPEAAQILMEDNASEMSVHFHPALGKWVAVYSYPDLRPGFPQAPPADDLWLRTADALAGPWSQRVSIYRVPELSTSSSVPRDPNTFCYAGKEHPQFARAGTLFVTYVCNLFTPKGQDPYVVLGRLLDRMDLYRPQPVSIRLDAGRSQ